MTRAVITFTSDFGSQDGYTGIVKGVMATISPAVPIIDISHEVGAWDIAAGAWVIYNAYKHFPAGSIHLGVVDPGVGSQRQGLLLSGQRHCFVGPDNGLCSYLLNDHDEIWQAFRLTNQNYWRRHISHTFHARDIFGPVSAYLSCGLPAAEFGEPISLDSVTRLADSQFIQAPPAVSGKVIYADRWGNLITNIRIARSGSAPPANAGESNLRVIINEQVLALTATYSSVDAGKPAAFVGSHGFLEIAVNCGCAGEYFQATAGTAVTLQY